MNKSSFVFNVLCSAALAAVPSTRSFAGSLYNDPAALGTLETSFNDAGLSGVVDAAVYTSDAFSSEFGNAGYVPFPERDKPVFVYVYQVLLDASSAPLTQLDILATITFAIGGSGGGGGIVPPEYQGPVNLSWFDLSGGVPPSTIEIDDSHHGGLPVVEFDFANGLSAGQASAGLVMSSIALPGLFPLNFVDSANAEIPIQTISPYMISPEPSALILAALGGLALLTYRRRG